MRQSKYLEQTIFTKYRSFVCYVAIVGEMYVVILAKCRKMSSFALKIMLTKRDRLESKPVFNEEFSVHQEMFTN